MHENDEDVDEGARSFARFLEAVDQGEANQQASDQLLKLMRIMRQLARATQTPQVGRLTLKFGFAVEPNDTVQVAYQVEIKEPSRKTARSHFWLTPGSNLSVENPRQMKLALRDVGAGAREIVDIDPRTGEVTSRKG